MHAWWQLKQADSELAYGKHIVRAACSCSSQTAQAFVGSQIAGAWVSVISETGMSAAGCEVTRHPMAGDQGICLPCRRMQLLQLQEVACLRAGLPICSITFLAVYKSASSPGMPTIATLPTKALFCRHNYQVCSQFMPMLYLQLATGQLSAYCKEITCLDKTPVWVHAIS